MAFVHAQGVPLITFEEGQRKDTAMAEHVTRFGAAEGVVFVGRARRSPRPRVRRGGDIAR